MQWLAEALRHNAELALFLVLGLGYLLGRLKLGSQPMGAVLGVLLVGLVVGQAGITLPDEVKWILFYFFLFAIGFTCGPQFVQGLRSSAAIQIGLTVLFVAVALSGVYVCVSVFHFNPGTGAGVFAGALTASAAMGVAGDAISKFSLPDAQLQAWQASLTTAFAASYFIGVLVTTWFLARLGPRIMRVDLVGACKQLETDMGSLQAGSAAGSTYREFVVRAYRVTSVIAGTTAADLESRFAGARVFVERVRSGSECSEAEPTRRLLEGDVVALWGRDEVLLGPDNPLRQAEVADRELTDVASQTATVKVTSKALAGRSLGALAALADTQGVFLEKLERAGQELPKSMTTTVYLGDRMTLTGRPHAVAMVALQLGAIERPQISTNMVAVALTIVVGGLIGIPAIRLGGVELGLSVSVGILLGGLLLGWLWSNSPRSASLPEPVLWVFDSVGLTGFVAVTALSAGPQFVDSLRASGWALVASSVGITILPHLVTLLVGRFVLGVHPGILLGICAGAGTSAPGLAAVQEAAQSRVPTLGYGVTYALGNLLVAFGASLLVVLLASQSPSASAMAPARGPACVRALTTAALPVCFPEEDRRR